MNIMIGRELVIDPILALTLPIINLPEGTKQIRIRKREGEFCIFYIRAGRSLQKCVCAFVDDRTAMELIAIAGNFTR